MSPEPTSAEIGELKKKLEENADSLVFAPLADAYRRQGKLEDALSVCKKGLEKHPHYASARVVFGRILQDQGKVEDAFTEFKKVLEGDPENIMAHTLVGGVLMQKKDYQSAIEEYQRVLTLNPDDDGVQVLLKEAIEKASGENKVATQPKPPPERKPAAERKPGGKENTASLTLAELYYKQGHFDKAIEGYQELLVSDPQNQILRQKLNDAVAKQGEAAKTVRPPKKDAFTKPPDQKEDNIEGSPTGPAGPKAGTAPLPRETKSRSSDDTKFTSEDILQVMQGGGKDDVMVEERHPAKAAPAPPPPPPPPPPPAPEPVRSAVPVATGGRAMATQQTEQIKGILAELAGTEGIVGSIMTFPDGEPAVSVGDTGNDPAGMGRLAAAIFDSTNQAAERLGQGCLQQVLITAETGYVILVNSPGGHLIVLANDRIKLGLLRLALDPAVKKLEKVF